MEPQWVEGLENVLARSPRPGYGSLDVPAESVNTWLVSVNRMGIQSIICLLNDHQLHYYSRLPNGLLDYYTCKGFQVTHIPITDPTHDERGWQELDNNLENIYEAFKTLPKPVLVHCSAGIDRTGRAINYIQECLRKEKRKR
jgi:protein tyrosine phosphatase